MPRYEYQCGCGVLFEGNASLTKHKDPKPCPDCGKAAPRKMPTDVSGSFNQTAKGPGPQNTGVASFDAHIDRVIGQHAKQGWEAEDKRREEKRRVLRQSPGAKSEDLSMNPDGTYRVRPKQEKELHERAVTINDMAQRALRPPPKPQ